jgi:hypothetical protein
MIIPDPTIPAIAELIGLGQRFVLWKGIKDRQKGKTRKVPLQARNGKAASSTDPATWASWEDCRVAKRRHWADGIGITFDGSGHGGVDLDSCRDPTTGAIAEWAMCWIREINSYAEVSPSGTGIKVYFKAEPVPELQAHKRTIGEASNGADHPPAIELYVTKRWFALTGQHLDGTPDEITDATKAVQRLARWIAEGAGAGAAAQADLPLELQAALEGDPQLQEAWAGGGKLTSGGDRSRSGLEFSLVLYLARCGWTDERIELALRHYPHGQIGAGALNERNAQRRLEKLLRKADEERDKARRWQEAQRWQHGLLRTAIGDVRDCLANGAIVLRQDPAFAGRIRFDEHRLAIVCRDLPWRRGEEWREWTDIDGIRLAEWCQLRAVPLRSSTCAEAVMTVADDHRVHPIRDWLDGLAWDSTPRLSSWLSTYL